jgi:Spy/CpxP family protein refolding chaperone
MNRADMEKLIEVRDNFQKDTLELRKQLVLKQMELTTLWAQPKLEPVAAEKLANEIAQLQAELGKKRSKHLIRCRQQFGGQDWTCPGIWLGIKIPE